MIELYLVRHGKTVWNNEHRFQGAWGDSPLVEKDLIRINNLAKRLEGTKFAAIYASPVKRAFQTAQLLAKEMHYDQPVRVAEAIREINFGLAEGKTTLDLAPDLQSEMHLYFNEPAKYDGSLTKGESYREAGARTQFFIKTLLDTYPDGSKIILVAHGAILNILINAALGTPLNDYRKRGGLANVSLSILDVSKDKPADLVVFNDKKHITDEEASDTI